MANSKTTIYNKPGQSKPIPDGKPIEQPKPVFNIEQAGGGVQIGGAGLFQDIDAVIIDDPREIQSGREEELRQEEEDARSRRLVNTVYREQRFRDSLSENDISLPPNLGANPNATIGALADFFDEVTSTGSDTTGAVALERTASTPRATSSIQSANRLAAAVSNQVSLERETAVPNLLAVLRTDLLYPPTEEDFQTLINNLAKLEIHRQLAPEFSNAPDLAGQFLGLPIDLAAFRGDVTAFLSLINEARLAVARVRESLTDERSLASILLERLNYQTDVDIDVYPTSFLVDCLLTDAFGTAVLGNVTSLKLPRLPQLDLGLRSTTGALRFDRGLDMDLPSPYPTERGVSFGDFTYANPNTPTENKPELPQFLGGQLGLNRLYQGFNEDGITSEDKVRRTSNLINQIRTGGASFRTILFNGDRFGRLPLDEKTSAVLDPLVREISISRETANREPLTFDTGPLSGLKGFELFKKIQEGLLGEFVSINNNTISPYNLTNGSGVNTVRGALQTANNGDLILEEAAIARKEKPMLARSITEKVMWASLKAMRGGENRQDLLKLQSDVQGSYDAVSRFQQSLSSFTAGGTEASRSIVNTRIKPCMQAMFAWSETPPTNIADTEANFAEYNRYRTPFTAYPSTILIDGTELLPEGSNFGTGLTADERYRMFDLVMQEMFDRAYIIDGGDPAYREALHLIVQYKILQDISDGVSGEAYSYGGDENVNAAKVTRSLRDRFGSIQFLGTRREVALTFNFAFLATIKEIVNSGADRNFAEGEIDESIGPVPSFLASNSEITTLLIDLSNRTSSDYRVVIDDVEYDLLAPFGSLQSFRSSVRNNPAVLAAYVSLCSASPQPNSVRGTGLNIVDMVARWVDKFLELNSDCFDTSNGGNANFTRNFPYSLEYITGIATRVAVEGVLASNISFWQGYNQYTLESLGDANQPKLKVWRPLSTSSFNDLYQEGMTQRIDSYINSVSENLIASFDTAQNLTNEIANLVTRLRLIKDRVDDIVEATEQTDRFPYLRALANSSQANDFSRLLLASMTSGYSTIQALCNPGFSTQSAEGRASELPMTMLRGGISQRDALDLTSLMAASGLLSQSTETAKRARSRVRTLCIGIPNGFMTTADTSDFYIPVLANQRRKTQSQTQEYNSIDYRTIRLDIKRRDLRFAGDNQENNVSTPVSIDWPVDLRVVSIARVGDAFPLKDFRGKVESSFANRVGGSDPYFFETVAKNFTFTIGKFDLHAGELQQTFDLAVGAQTANTPPAIRNLITSYCLGIFYAESVGTNFDESVMVSDKRFFSASIPTAAVPTVKAEALRLHGITENEIESVLEREPVQELGASRRLIKFRSVRNSSLNLNPRQQLVLSYVMSAANKLQVSDGFLRSISPKAFDQVAYIPIDVSRGGFDLLEAYSNRPRSNSKNYEFKYSVTESEESTRNSGGDIFSRVNRAPETFNRPLGRDTSLNETLPCEFWVELVEEAI